MNKVRVINISRWILGGLFSFSGIVKCVDPVGTAVFVEKYLAAFSLDVFLPIALPIAIVLSVAEFTLGQLLLDGKPHRITAIATLAIMSLFTIVTLLNATVLPIGDCGCFGDAIRLTPVQTLIKNVVLLPLSALMIVGACRGKFNYLQTAIGVAISLGVCLYSLRYQPIIDFMPFRVGVNLREEIMRERQELDSQSATYLVFSNAEGEELLFESDDTECWLRDDLEFVESRSEAPASVLQPFAEFIVTSAQGEECTLDFLAENSDVLLLTVYDVDALSGRRLKAAKELLDGQQRVVVLTSAEASVITEILGVEPFMLDAMTLRSLIRSRVGVVEINAGVIVRKCDVRDL